MAFCAPVSLRISSLALAAALSCAQVAEAGVIVDATRVVYAAGKREVSVGIRNAGDQPSLVQIWVENGSSDAGPREANAPFALTPPLFRLDPAKAQTLRLVYTGQPLPTDRETVFWLNVLDVPPRISDAAAVPNRLEMAFRHRLKLFFRPRSLPGDPGDAAAAVVWRLVHGGGKLLLEARNPTPFHVSFARAEVSGGGATSSAETDMVAPFASRQFSLSEPSGRLTSPVTVTYAFIDDFGAVVSGEATASAAP